MAKLNEMECRAKAHDIVTRANIEGIPLHDRIGSNIIRHVDKAKGESMVYVKVSTINKDTPTVHLAVNMPDNKTPGQYTILARHCGMFDQVFQRHNIVEVRRNSVVMSFDDFDTAYDLFSRLAWNISFRNQMAVAIHATVNT